MKPAFKLNESTGRYHATRPLTSVDIIEQSKLILSDRLTRSDYILTSPEMTCDFLITHLAGLEHEVFSCIFLTNRHRVICFENLFRGTIDGASVYPREVVKAALKYNAAAVIFAHNHPSGYAEPSQADKQITMRLKDALSLTFPHN